MSFEPDPALVDVLAKREPQIRRGEDQAYKKAVIRMVLVAVHEREAALDGLLAFSQEWEGLE